MKMKFVVMQAWVGFILLVIVQQKHKQKNV